MGKVNSDLKLFLFTVDLLFAQEAEQAGVDSIIVDWEQKGKKERQSAYDTEVNSDTPADVLSLAHRLTIPITVRVNPLSSSTAEEISVALDHGATIIMLPMAQSSSDVKEFIRIINGRATTIVQLETQSLLEDCESLRDLEWNYLYIGLNDLMVSRKSNWIWDPLLDSTVDKIFTILQGREVGFGGVTIIGGGYPVPFIDLLREMARNGCRLSFLRRTFKREILGRNFKSEIQAVRSTWTATLNRSPHAIEADHKAFVQKLRDIRNAQLSVTQKD